MFRPVKGKLKIVLKVFLLSLLVFLNACSSANTPAIKESEAFYINDNESVLLNSTEWTIYNYGKGLYDDSQEQEYIDAKINGTQIVIAAYVGQAETINTTDVFNSWKIGENDMGILIVLYFSPGEEKYQYVYNEMTFEIGAKMSGYLSAFTAENMITEYFDDPSIPSYDYDERLISLYFGLLKRVYLNIYNYDSFDYQSFIDEYNSVKYEYIGPISSAYIDESLPIWVWVIIIFGIIFFGVLPGGLFFSSVASGGKGGGGSSGGYWFRH
ncbi:MAG: hypothetical protein WC366_02985 [Bacilli bacterium]|jgi:uncharacterized protein